MPGQTSDLKTAQIPSDYFGLGLLLDLLSRHQPFRHYTLETSTQLAKHHLEHGLNRALLKDDKVVGYVGGIYIDMQQGEAWLYQDTPFKPVDPEQANAVAITAAIHEKKGCTRTEFVRFLAASRNRLGGYPVYFGRHGADGTLRRVRLLTET